MSRLRAPETWLTLGRVDDFGTRLARAMEAQGVSARELGRRLFGDEKMEDGRRQVRRWRDSKHEPRASTIKEIARALGVSVLVLLEDQPAAQVRTAPNGRVPTGDELQLESPPPPAAPRHQRRAS